MTRNMFVDNPDALLRTLVVGVLGYFTLIVLLRISGKRTLASMNAFDLIVTVALGSTLASALISKDVSLAQGALAFALLIALQFAITWTSVRLRWVRRAATGDPTLLAFRGKLIDGALRRARVTRDELMAALRSAGHGALAEVEAVVLETDGSFSVVPRGAGSEVLEDIATPATACGGENWE
jgi:uncharacterized membrane protein YcaP (DUF421 family)